MLYPPLHLYKEEIHPVTHELYGKGLSFPLLEIHLIHWQSQRDSLLKNKMNGVVDVLACRTH